MKKRLIALFVMTLLLTTSTSATTSTKDSTVVISATELKQANLIFAEHKKLLNENKLLWKQIDNYKNLNSTLVEMDSLRSLQYKGQLEKNKKTLRKWQIGGISLSSILLLLFIFK